MSKKETQNKQTIGGHVRVMGIAIAFGLLAYAVIHGMMWLSHQMGGTF